MGSVLFWLLVVVCVVALVLLFFPFKFNAEFDLGERGALVRLFLFKKLLWTYEKAWKEKSKKEDEPEDDFGDAAPSFVDTASVRESAPVAPMRAPTPQETANPQETPQPQETASKPESAPEAAAKPAPKPAPNPVLTSAPEKPEEEKPEKRSLTDAEFWTIILTPDMDVRAFRYVKRLLASLVRVFRIKFEDCFAEGIRADYKTMGYGAALNGIMKGFPYLSAWDIRMDWCMERELHAAGKICASVNLCRVLAFVAELALYAGILLFLFWRRRAKVLKTGELPELGYIRKKILAFIVEE